MKQRMVTVLHPNFNPHPNGLRGDRVFPSLNDYITVPWISTLGTYRVTDLLPTETIGALARMANAMEKGKPVARGARPDYRKGAKARA